MNDGGIDGRGRWWASTMDLDEQNKVGRLWCLENGGVREVRNVPAGGRAAVMNGPIWVAANSRGKVIWYSPTGTAVAVVSVPGAKMTSCPAFGGSDMKTPFITPIVDEVSTVNVYRVSRRRGCSEEPVPNCGVRRYRKPGCPQTLKFAMRANLYDIVWVI